MSTQAHTPALHQATLVIGGVRSGKSRFVQEYATRLSAGGRVVFIATARHDSSDLSLAARIARHRASRPAHWETVEAPVALSGAITALAIEPPPAAILVDCLTLWLSNMLLRTGDAEAKDFADRARVEFEHETAALLSAIRSASSAIVLVTNEVGSGIAPATALGNVFADLQGELNQAVAAECATVFHVVAGIPTRIK